MFCPTCGKDNSLDLKFCASCGTNLYAVLQTLTGREDDFFTKIDSGMDSLLARYSEHVFRHAPKRAAERRVLRSWQILGQSLLTSVLDLLLFTLMATLLPIRLLLLIVSTPFRLLAERGTRDEQKRAELTEYEPPALAAGVWRHDPSVSVTDNTTTLFDTGKIKH
ncbi:MAG TPA: zinc ribbon domain-containing protein [Pyrinomonadaceae bacterium]|jgi:hypothetical protein|nr:zinc ribbon domain-containing protein [Pyrinomonadaceae bacterium]